jgi:hypothetical protein
VQQPQAGLEIKAPLSFFFWGLYLFPPKVSIDGSAPISAKWGDNLLPMTPGRHQVTFWWPAYWFLPSNKASVTVDIAQGQVAKLLYKPRWLFFLEGRMQQVGVRPMLAGGQAQISQAANAQPAGWHPDPARRHELRYWNGTTWTDDVSNGGVAAKDPAGST